MSAFWVLFLASLGLTISVKVETVHLTTSEIGLMLFQARKKIRKHKTLTPIKI